MPGEIIDLNAVRQARADERVIAEIGQSDSSAASADVETAKIIIALRNRIYSSNDQPPTAS